MLILPNQCGPYIIISMTSTFRCEYCQCFTFKRWRNISARDSLTKTRNTEHSFTARRPPSCLQSRHFRFYPPLPSRVFLIGWQFLFFINRKIKKRFSFWISPALILFPEVSLHMKLLCQV